MSGKGKKQKVTVSLNDVSECVAICGVDGEEICHHRESETRLIEAHSKTELDRVIDTVRVNQSNTHARVTDSIEWLD